MKGEIWVCYQPEADDHPNLVRFDSSEFTDQGIIKMEIKFGKLVVLTQNKDIYLFADKDLP